MTEMVKNGSYHEQTSRKSGSGTGLKQIKEKTGERVPDMAIQVSDVWIKKTPADAVLTTF
jgi:hypothetical protein